MRAETKPGRPRTSKLTRAEQLRAAKRAQREREQGLARCVLKLPLRDAERLRAALTRPGFLPRLQEFLAQQVIAVKAYDNLALLMWSRTERFVTGQEALRIYERNWRFVDVRRMQPKERALIDRLVREYGNGVLHV